MKLQLLDDRFCVCKIDGVSRFDIQSDFFFLAKTEFELSLVCKEKDAPKDSLAIDKHWRALRVEGTLDFSLVGILSNIASVLAKAGIPIFAVSTYDTDYILLKEGYLDKALNALKEAEYTLN